jgi:hypothetical protein
MPQLGEQLESVRGQLRDARAALDAAERVFDADASVALAAKVATLQRFERELIPQARTEREAEASDAARQRIRGMRSALGSHLTSLADDEERVRDAARALASAIERLNDRFRGAEKLRAEFTALVDRFDLSDEAPLRTVDEPDHAVSIDLPALATFAQRAPITEEHPEVRSWRRRTYAEVHGTKGGDIIATVGPKDWPPLPPHIAEAIERDRRQTDQNARVVEREAGRISPSGPFALSGTV